MLVSAALLLGTGGGEPLLPSGFRLAVWPPLPPPPPPPPPSPEPPPPSPHPPPPEVQIDDDVREAVSAMSIEQKVGQMTQIDISQVVSYTGNCKGGFLWADRRSCQPELDRQKLRTWLSQFGLGSLLNSPYASGCVGSVCGWTAAQFRAFVREVQLEAAAAGAPLPPHPLPAHPVRAAPPLQPSPPALPSSPPLQPSARDP